MENWRFYADHLKSNSDEQRQEQADVIPLVKSQHRAVNISHEQSNDEITNSSEQQEHAQAKNDLHRAIQTLKKNLLKDTDLKQPFLSLIHI